MKSKFPFWILLAVLIYACGSNDTVKKEPVVNTTNDSSLVIEDTLSTAMDTIVSPSSSVTSKEVDLKFNLQKGKSYAYAMDFEVGQDRQGKKMSTGMKWKYNVKVLSDDGTKKTLETTYDRIAMSMDMGGQKMEFDSDAPAGNATNPLNMISNLFSAVKGKSFTMKVDKKGEITEVKGFDQIGEAVVNQLNLPAEARAGMIQQFKTQFNDRDVKATFSQFFEIFPGKKVKQGDSWERESTAKLGRGQGKMITTYKLRQILGNKAILSANSTLNKGDTTSSGTQTAKLVVDINTGLVLQNNFELIAGGEKKMVSRGKITGKQL